MTVKELKNTLEYYDEDMEVLINGDNSGGYVDSINDTDIEDIRAFYGNDFQAVVLNGRQVGMTD